MGRSGRSSPKRIYKKKFIWTHKNEKLLLKLWKERINDLKSTRKSMPIYVDIQLKLKKNGCNVEVGEIRHKFHNMSTKYR